MFGGDWEGGAEGMSILSCLFISTGAVAVINEQFSDADVSILLSGVNCIGSELSILTCPNSTDSQPFCEAVEDAAAVCQGVYSLWCVFGSASSFCRQYTMYLLL